MKQNRDIKIKYCDIKPLNFEYFNYISNNTEMIKKDDKKEYSNMDTDLFSFISESNYMSKYVSWNNNIHFIFKKDGKKYELIYSDEKDKFYIDSYND